MSVFIRESQDILSNGSLLDQIETPAVLLRTYMGNLLYSPPGLSEEAYIGNVGPVIAHIELGDFVEKDFGSMPLHTLQLDPTNAKAVEANFSGAMANKYTGAIMHPASTAEEIHRRQSEAVAASLSGKSKVLPLLSGRSLRDGVGLCNNNSSVSVTTPSGRKTVTAAQYAQLAAAGKAALVVSLADESPLDCTSKNRISRAIERTKKMFQDICGACGGLDKVPFFLFGVALTGHLPGSLAVSAKEAVAAGAKGVAVGGVNQGETEEAFSTAVRAVREATLCNTPSGAEVAHVPVLVPSCDSLRRLLLALESGADLVSSNLPFLLTGAGHAMALDWDYIDSVVETRRDSSSSETDAASAKRRRIPPFLDLWDACHSRDRSALLGERGTANAKCPCHACKHHTRAYVHHLLCAKELLSEVLLYSHNQAQLLEMLRRARQHGRRGAAGLACWLGAVGEVYDLTEVDWAALQSKKTTASSCASASATADD